MENPMTKLQVNPKNVHTLIDFPCLTSPSGVFFLSNELQVALRNKKIPEISFRSNKIFSRNQKTRNHLNYFKKMFIKKYFYMDTSTTLFMIYQMFLTMPVHDFFSFLFFFTNFVQMYSLFGSCKSLLSLIKLIFSVFYSEKRQLSSFWAIFNVSILF